jgi:hypothetical protein
MAAFELSVHMRSESGTLVYFAGNILLLSEVMIPSSATMVAQKITTSTRSETTNMTFAMIACQIVAKNAP